MQRFSREIKIGLAGIVTVAILYYGISFLKGMNLFSTTNTYYVTFTDIAGLPQSSPVYADGYNIGVVSDIIYDYANPRNVVVEITVDNDMRIPAGSSANLESSMLGSIKMNLLLANNPLQRIEPGDTIRGMVNGGLMETAAALIPQLEKLLPKMDSILTSVNALLSDPSLANILHNTDHMTDNLNAATAKLDKLMGTDIPQLTQHLNQVCTHADTMMTDMDAKINQLDVEGLMQKVNGTLANVESLTTRLNSKDNTVGLLLNDPTLYHNLTLTTQNAASLLGDLQAHPKRYVHFSLFGKKDKAQ